MSKEQEAADVSAQPDPDSGDKRGARSPKPCGVPWKDIVRVGQLREAQERPERLKRYEEELAYRHGRWQVVLDLFDCPVCKDITSFDGPVPPEFSIMQTPHPDASDTLTYRNMTKPQSREEMMHNLIYHGRKLPEYHCGNCSAAFSDPLRFTRNREMIKQALADYDRDHRPDWLKPDNPTEQPA